MERKERVMRKGKLFLVTFGVMLSMVGCGSNDVIVDVVTNKDSGQVSDINSTNNTAESNNEANNVAETNPAGCKTISKENVKIGVLYIGSEEDTSGYTYAHEIGIQGMISNIGLKDDQVVRKNNIDDSDTEAIKKAIDECLASGCNIIFGTSWGYMETMNEYAEKNPDVYFAHGTGYMSNNKNFTNYFGRIYQARYLSGIVAGLKTNSNKVGYVSAMGSDNSECTGGIDAFALGVESVNKDAKVYVAVTNSWFSPEDEQKASEALVAEGCDVLAQHVDTIAPQTVSADNGTWAIGYNSDMSKETPDATLTSVIWNWSAYYTSYVNSIINATYDGMNYYGGMDQSLVSLTNLSDICNPDTSEKVNEAQQKILSGEIGVFDGVLETNDGSTVGEAGKTLDDATITGGINWYYRNVVVLDWK